MFFKKKEKVILNSPCDGDLIPLSSVEDEVFSSGMMGEGFAVIPNEGNMYAPISGVIATIFETKHAICITTEEGLDILIHMGIDTVELKGEPFETYVSIGDKVQSGQLLAKMDIESVLRSNKNTSVIVIITNSQEKVHNTKLKMEGIQHNGTEVLSVKLNS